jgi:dihydroorotate dehydrogenase
MYELFRPLLFRLEPERAHKLTLALLNLAGRIAPVRSLLRLLFAAPSRPVQVFGLTFPNPIGLAAGYDKDGTAWRGLACLGFGHIEVGTITPLPQEGNPQPRLFRLPEDQALINRMGFPGKGAQFAAQQLAGGHPRDFILGVNLGKGKDTPLEEAAQDYLTLMKVFLPLANYLAINVSSPNTPGLRRLQARQALEDLLKQLVTRRDDFVLHPDKGVNEVCNKPLLVKLAPDLTDVELNDALLAILAAGFDGVIATNTTLNRQGLTSPRAAEQGGLSGAPLRQLSTEIVRKIYLWTEGKLPVVGVGGVSSVQDAREKLDAGAVLVQLYTGLVYEGPGLVKRILTGLSS